MPRSSALTSYAADAAAQSRASASCCPPCCAIVFSTACGALFGVLALRASGIGFLMITLALGQIVWGIAYRANTITDGDNGLRFAARPHPFGIDITSAPNFYWFTLDRVRDRAVLHLAPHALAVRRRAAGRARPAAPHAHARP